MSKDTQKTKPTKRGIHHTTISVPDDVREAMREHSKNNDVNWSAIAVAAFRKLMSLPDMSVEGRLARLERRVQKLFDREPAKPIRKAG